MANHKSAEGWAVDPNFTEEQLQKLLVQQHNYFESEIYLNSYNNLNPILSAMNTEYEIVNEFMFFVAGVDEVGNRGIPAGSFVVYNGERGISLTCYYTNSTTISLNEWTKVTAKRVNGVWSLFINDIDCSISRFDDAGVPNDQFGNQNLFVYIGRAEADDVNFDGEIRNLILNNKLINNKISIKKQNLGGGKLKTYNNILLNSKFDQNNFYPFDGFDANYYIDGWSGGGSRILENYYHNSPLFYGADQEYRTLANKTFHEINSPYTTLLYGHTLQPRLLKMFGAGTKFGSLNNTNYLKTITSTTSLTPTDNQSWTKYGVEQIIAIPSWARKVKYGVKYLIISGDEFRFNNFGGLEVYFQKGINRSYVNLNMVRKPVSVDTTALDSLETLYTLNNYVNFDSAYANAMCQWLGPNTSKVKVRRKSSVYIDGSNLDIFNVLSDTIDIPIFSTSGGSPDLNNGFPDYISIQMFFAEWVSYLNNSGIPSGAIYFYEPFLYFTEF